MRETELFFPSFDGTSEIRALLWEPDDYSAAGGPDSKNARCVLQILHGVAEHIERYRDFADYCTTQGFIVCGHDHVGHGKSVKSPEQWGHVPLNGKEVYVEDAHRLRQLAQKRYCSASTDAPLPYVMLGHSMGSFILRIYLTLYAEGLAAAVISGTGQPSPVLSKSGSLLARLLSATKGVEHKSPLLFNLTVGAYSKQIAPARTPLDWLSTDEAVVDKYIAAPDCGFWLGNGGNYALTALTGAMVKREAAAAVPLSLPLLFIAGSEDPVGEKGAGVKRAFQLFEDTGHTNATLLIYEGMRHEVLNERDKKRVYDDVVSWISSVVAKTEPDDN
jgi:alpha-beta hydrolase superfamily lysophospholipase